MMLVQDCDRLRDRICDYCDGTLGTDERLAFEQHLQSCAPCRESLSQFRAMRTLLDGTLEAPAIGEAFNAETGKRLHAVTTGFLAKVEPMDEPAPEGSAAESVLQRMGGAPWWAISVALHVLLVALLGLITMAVSGIGDRDSVVVVTSLERAPRVEAIEADKKKPEIRDILDSKHDTPATDPNSTVASDIVVPPDILAKAELSDHFETVNPDRPDTHSAFGNPDAHMFHSESGNDEAAGGGGNGGAGLMEDLIGVGGATSPGTGGGWGGGNGTGTGVDNGGGHGSFGQRNGGGRRLLVMKHGGSKATESAVDAALNWLALHQEVDGHWDIKKYEGGGNVSGGTAYDESVTALAVLAFLGAGHSSKVGRYRDNVKRGIYWLLSKQRPDGTFTEGPRSCGYDIYDTTIATLALAEHFGMTKDDESGKAAQKGVDYLMKVQLPHGGWTHGGYDSTSVLGWVVMALKSAKMAKLTVPAAGFEGALRRLEGISEKTPDGYWGKVGYAEKGQYAYQKGYTCTAIGMVCLQFMGKGAETTQQAEMLSQIPPEWKPGETVDPQNMYHWYYTTLGMFQVGGAPWKKWNEALKTALLPHQRVGAQDVNGSWDPVTYWDATGGRVYTTAMGALCLEVYYRYLPLYR